METTEYSESDAQSLVSMFQEGLDLFNNLGKIDEPTNSPSVQINVRKSIRIFEDATRLVSLSGMFSTNEGVEEIATEDLRYLLLPALLGSLCLKLTAGSRKDITNVAETYYKDFLQRCTDYGLCNYKFNNSDAKETNTDIATKSEMQQLRDSVNTRANKIHRFKQQKELKTKLEDLKKCMDNENVDEDLKRNYFLTMIKSYIYEAVDELTSIEAEKEILVHIANLNKNETVVKPKRPPSQPLRPVIITKDQVQKAVFGAGYPSLPVMSVEDFYEKRVADGIFPGPNSHKSGGVSLQDAATAGVELRDDIEDEERERKLEDEDPDLMDRMRRQDEYKDEHRRGWGNRMNRS